LTSNNKKERWLKPGKLLTDDDDIRLVLEQSKTIAVLGLSPKPERDSHRVAAYLQQQGYRIIPIRPAQKELLGEKAFSSLDDVQAHVDIINVFRNPAQVLQHAQEALQLHPRVFWMQLRIKNRQAAELLTAAGINVVMNRCIKADHARLFG
jgi:predicted CoA-binding protein